MLIRIIYHIKYQGIHGHWIDSILIKFDKLVVFAMLLANDKLNYSDAVNLL